MKKRINMVFLAVMLMLTGTVMTGCGSVDGSWQLDKLKVGENIYTIEALAKAVNSQKADEVDISLEIQDEEFTLYSSGEVIAEGACIETDEGYSLDVDGRSVNAVRGNGELILYDMESEVKSEMIFVKK